MTDKHFISAQQLLEDSFALGAQILESGFRPDFITAVWRGGTPVGIAIQELLEYAGVVADHISVRASGYQGLDARNAQTEIRGLEDLAQRLGCATKLLIVDDVYDTGRSIAALREKLRQCCGGNTPTEIKVATPWYKPGRNQTAQGPDYYLHETEKWLVFPHEIIGLDASEIADGKPEIAKIVNTAAGLGRHIR